MLKDQFSRIYWFLKYQYAKSQARKTALTRLKQQDSNRILVLCYGNIYRSPLVERYLKQKLDGQGVNVDIKSAGFFHKSGRASATDYVEMVKTYNIDLGDHRSTTVNREMFEWADLVIIMDGKNYKLSLLLDPTSEDKLIWLGGFCSDYPVEIEDPYNKSADEKRLIVEQLLSSSDYLIDKLT